MAVQLENIRVMDAPVQPHKKAKSEIKEMVAKLFIILIILFISSIYISGVSALQIAKEGSTISASFGETIYYSYEITNDDGVDLHDVTLYDDKLGDISVGDLAAGDTWNTTINHLIVESDMPGPLKNVAWATGIRTDGNLTRSNNASWEVGLGFEGLLSVSKSADAIWGYIDKSINYTIIVKNPNSFALKNLTVEDLIYHPFVIRVKVEMNRTELLPGEVAMGKATYIVDQLDIMGPPQTGPRQSPAIITDYANALGYPPWSDPDDPYAQSVSGVASRNIGITYTTSQSVSKSASQEQGAKGDRTTFRITVNNTGDTLLNRTEIIDLLPKGLTFISSTPATTSQVTNSNGTTTLYWENLSQSFGTFLYPGQQFQVQVIAEFSGAEYGKLTNTVTSRISNLRKETKSSQSSKDVYARKQNIVVVKTPDVSMGSLDAVVNYTLEIQNTGNISLNNVFVSDILPEGMSYVSSSHGGVNRGQYINWSDVGPLAIGAAKQLWVNARIDGPVIDRETLTNHVYVEGRPEFGYNVTNTTSASVEALKADIAITKGATPSFGSPGAEVIFSVNVTNNGIAPLPHVFVSDLLPAGLNYVSSNPEGTAQGQNITWADIGPMESGESRQLQIVSQIAGPISGSKILTNLVEVSGKPDQGKNVTANATATVRAGEARIDVVKSADPAFGSPSTNVTFTLNVTNSGAVPLPHVSVSDLLPAGMSYVSSTLGGTNQGQNVSWSDIGPMNPGDGKRLEIVAHIDAPIAGSKTLTNLVEVFGMPEHGENVTANASAEVLAREARIEVVKTADPVFGSPGSLVTFSINVTNSGAARLPHVFVRDQLPAGMIYVSSAPAGTSRDQNVFWPDIGTLEAGETRILEIVARIEGPISGNVTLTNLVEISARPEHGENVTASDSADVQASEAKIAVAKSAEPAFGSPSTNVTFALDVTNSGAAPLPTVSVLDLLPDGMSYVSSDPAGTGQGQNVVWSNIGPLSPGSTRRLEVIAHIDGPIAGTKTLTNQVQATGKPQHGQNVTDNASAVVQASEAKIAITKTANPSFGSPSTIVTFTMDVTNSGAAPLPHIFVSDLLPDGMSYVSSSPAGISQGQNVFWSDIGPMESGSAKRLEVIAHIDGPIAGNKTLTNEVQVAGKPEHGGNVTANASAIVQASEANIAITKSAEPEFGSPGTTVAFKMNVTNTGAAPLVHVSVSDILPAGLSYISSSPAGANQGQNVLWSDIGPMAPGEREELLILAKISGPITGSKNLTNQVQATGQPEHGGDVTATATAIVLAREARIDVLKTADPVFGSPGTDVTFILDVKNNGVARLSSVFVSDLLPSGMSYISSSPAGINQGQNVHWSDIGPMAPGESQQLRIVARINGPISGSTNLTNQVDVAGKPEHGDNVTASASVQVSTSEAKISVAKSAQPEFGSPGTTVTFDLEVTNAGAARLANVFVRDLLPAGMSYISSSPAGVNQGQSVLWSDIGPMSSGEKKQLQIVARIEGPISGSLTLTNLVEVEGRPEHGENVTSSDRADVFAREARIDVVKSADPSFGSPGTDVTFTLNVTNAGAAYLPHVFVSDLLPSGMSYVSSSPAGVNQGQSVLWSDIGPMSSGENKLLQIVARINAPLSGSSTFTNLVEVSARPEHGENVTASGRADVFAREARINVSKSADPSFGSPGTDVTFTLNVTNTGAAHLPHVFVSDLLPMGMSYISSSPAGVNQGQSVLWSDIGPMSSGENKQLQIVARIDAPLSGSSTFTNLVEVQGRPEHGENVSASATAIVLAREARIDVVKSADPSFGSPGTDVTFTLNVTNAGAAYLPHVFVSDLLPVGMSYISSSPAGVNQGQSVLWSDIGPMSSGENKLLQIVARINAPLSGSSTFTNLVEVEGRPEHGDNVTASDMVDVTAREARIDVVKSADPSFGSPGTDVTFTMEITNSGATPLPHVTVSDLLPMGLSYISSSPAGVNQGQSVLWSDIGPMDPQEKKQLQIVARIDGPLSGTNTLTNQVVATGQPEHGENVSASATAIVLASEAKITVAKKGEPSFGSPGTEVSFALEVTNNGAAPLPHVFVSDLLPAGLSYVSSSPAGVVQGQNVSWADIGLMDVGESRQLQIVARIDAPLSGIKTLTNLVGVAGQPEHGDNVTASASADVLASEAEITVAKMADPSFGSPSTNVTFTIDVANSGAAPLPHVFVSDLLPEGMSYVSSSPAGSNRGQTVSWPDIGPMNSGDSRQLQIVAHIDSSISGSQSLTNMVEVAGKPEHGENVTANASALVQANEARIAVAKMADPAYGSPGTEVTFTLEVTNSGAAALPHVFVSDLLPTGLSYVSSSPTGSNQGQQVFWSDIGPMAPAESEVLQIVARINGPISGSQTLTNLVEVTGQPDHGGNVSASATAIVSASEAEIIVVKEAEPAYGSPGALVTFGLEVTNSGDSDLPHVYVHDLLPTGLSYVSSSPAGISQGRNISWSDIGPLSSGEKRTLEIVARIEGPITGSHTLTNLVEIEGKPEHGENVTASDSADILASEARISIEKSANPSFGSPGTEVTFTLEVTNNGAAALPHVSVSDLLPAGLSYVSSSPSGAVQGRNVSWSDIGSMGPAESKTLKIVARIDGPITGSQTLINIAEAVGKPEYGNEVKATDSAPVQATEADIIVTKTADPSFGSPGTEVIFTLEVTNSGEAALPHVSASDLLPAGLSYVSSSPSGTNQDQKVFWSEVGPMAPGESKNLQIVARIDGPISGSQTLTNLIEVAGQPEHGENVTASASADVLASEAGISVAKSADPEFGSPGTEVTFTLEVTNNGAAVLPHVSVSDLLPVGLSYISSHPAGSSSGQKVFWSDIGPMSPGENKELQIVARIDGPISGSQTLTNLVEVAGRPEHGENVTASASADVLASEAKIAIIKTADPSFGSPSTDVTFTLKVTNNGAAGLPHVFVSDLLPAGLSYVSSSPAGMNQGQRVFWSDIGSMAPGDSRQLQIVAHIDGPISGSQTLTNQVEVWGQPEHGENVTASASADVLASEARISVSKSADPAFGSPGTDVTFTLEVTNSGAAALPRVSVSDLLPEGMSYVSSHPAGSSSGQRVIWSDIGPMASGESEKLQVVARIEGPILGSEILTNQVEVTGKPEHGKDVTANASADVQTFEAKISVAKNAEPAFGSQGTDVTFTLDVTNNGAAALPHVFVSDMLPAGLSYISSFPAGTNQGQKVSWSDIGAMAPGDSRQLQVVARIDGSISGSQTFTNLVEVAGRPEHGENVTASASADVLVSQASITVAKSAEPASGSPGAAVTFSLKVENNGAAALPHVFVSDRLPEGMSYISSNPAGAVQGRNVIWSDIGPMDSGSDRQLEIVARIDGPVSGSQTFTNLVEVAGRPEHGENVTASATADVLAKEAKITVIKSADPAAGTLGSVIAFNLNVTNNGEALLSPVFVSDLLPLGMEYTQSSPGGSNNGRYINWSDIGPLGPGATKSLWIKVRLDGTAYGTLVNRVDVTGRPESGEDISSSAIETVEAHSSYINATKTAGETDGLPGSSVNFTLSVVNTGAIEICEISAEDLLPEGLQYLGDDRGGELIEDNRVVWEDLGCLKPGEKMQIEMMTSITGTTFGELDNKFVTEGKPEGSDETVRSEAHANVTAVPSPFIITKTADKSIYRPGEEMTYTITICNPLEFVPLNDVVVKDMFDNRLVRVVGSYPEPGSDGQWHFAQIPPKSCVTITLVAVYPQSNVSFDGTQNISGTGFVNVHSDLTTGMASISITNCVSAMAKVGGQSWSRQTCASVKVEEIGTKLLIREHGSGLFRTDESTKLISENRSIISQKSVSASYTPVEFQLPNDRRLNYSSKWAEDTRGKNYVTGGSMHETYRYATSIDRDTYLKMDENGSEMKVDSSFNGTASIGFAKRSQEAGPKDKPVFEAQEDYSGQFRLNESFREYGSNAVSQKAAAGEGFVSSDRRIGESQRSYEFGSGSYSSEEMVDTSSNYMAKEISLAYKPENLSNPSAAGQNLRWSEGMWSKSGSMRGGDIVASRDAMGGTIKDGCATDNGTSGASIISESYSSLDYLKKDTVSLGLSEMRSNATFKGVADYKAKAVSTNGTDLLDSEDRYVGEFSTSRSIQLSGVSRYSQPHITVVKEGRIGPEWVARKNSTVAEYNISITNDGNRALAPVYVQDLFPPGTEYIGSSLEPAAISDHAANWTVLHLGIGDTLTITLKLNVTEAAPGNLLNRVSVSGLAGGEYVSASDYCTLEFDWMSCCQPMLAFEKQAQIDPMDPFLVHYSIFLKNSAKGAVAARLVDELPGGMSLIRADPQPESTDSQFIHWVIADIQPDQAITIEYTVRAPGNGDYVNNVHLEASALDGSGSYSSDATAYVDLGNTGRTAKTTRYDGWQPPDWDINTSEGISI